MIDDWSILHVCVAPLTACVCAAPFNHRNILDCLSLMMMVIVGALEFARVGTNPDLEDRAVGPMLCFCIILTFFKVGGDWLKQREEEKGRERHWPLCCVPGYVCLLECKTGLLFNALFQTPEDTNCVHSSVPAAALLLCPGL